MEYTKSNLAGSLEAGSSALTCERGVPGGQLARRGAVSVAGTPVVDALAQMAYFRRFAREHFQIPELHTHQEKVLTDVIAGRDILAVLPTGSGKTLCYALPAACRPGLVLVVSPLIALMRDQVARLKQYGIAVAALDSLQTPDEKRRIWDQISAGHLKVLIVSPERLALASFRSRLAEQHVQLVAIDEAHCISQWGFHFRPEYRRVGDYLRDLGDVQKIALTATATDRVRGEIRTTLELDSPSVIVADFRRENLCLDVANISSTADQLKSVVNAAVRSEGSGIVYASTRKQVFEIHDSLVKAGQSTAMYHAGLSPESRKNAHNAFMKGTVRIIVATNAFGLGIDKPDIRFVHHASLPASLEQYVQEIGRAGRDGKPAQCHLIAGSRDYYVHRYMIDKNFPELTLLRQSYDASRDFLGSTQGQSEFTLLNHLRMALKINEDDLRVCFDVLVREGLLVRFESVPQDYQDMDRHFIVGLGFTLEDEQKFWREYPLRKIDQLSRLDRMKTYVSDSTDRVEFLNNYFRA